MKKLTPAVVAFLLGIGLIAGTASPATAADSVGYAIGFTDGLGAYPRSAPDYGSKTGTALPEGTVIEASCRLYGGDVTNPYGYTSSAWVRDVSGLYWPEAWLDTGSEGVPPGLTSCDAAQETVSAPPSWQPTCTPGGDYIDGAIVVTDTGKGSIISITPTTAARTAWGNGKGWDSTVEMWHAIQDCVPGLYDGKADSVWQQLECHQRFATITELDGSYATGNSYDLETWTDPLDEPSDLNYVLSHCLNQSPDHYDSWFAPFTLFAMTG